LPWGRFTPRGGVRPIVPNFSPFGVRSQASSTHHKMIRMGADSPIYKDLGAKKLG